MKFKGMAFLCLIVLRLMDKLGSMAFLLSVCLMSVFLIGCGGEKRVERKVIKSTGSLEEVSPRSTSEKIKTGHQKSLTEEEYIQGLKNVIPALPLDHAKTLKYIDEILPQ